MFLRGFLASFLCIVMQETCLAIESTSLSDFPLVLPSSSASCFRKYCLHSNRCLLLLLLYFYSRLMKEITARDDFSRSRGLSRERFMNIYRRGWDAALFIFLIFCFPILLLYVKLCGIIEGIIYSRNCIINY